MILSSSSNSKFAVCFFWKELEFSFDSKKLLELLLSAYSSIVAVLNSNTESIIKIHIAIGKSKGQ